MNSLEEVRTTRLVEDLITKHIGGTEFSLMTGNVQIRVRQALRAAIAAGEIRELVKDAKTPLQREIATDAAVFEEGLENGVNVEKEDSNLYPWGWCYVNGETQQRFRQFCKDQARHR